MELGCVEPTKERDDDVDDYTKQFCYYIILQLGWVWKENNNNKRIETKRRREKKSSCLLSVSYVCLLFVHVSPSGYLNANEGDHDGLGCSQSRLHIINIHVSLSLALCVSRRRKRSLGSSAQDEKKRSIPFRTSDFLFVSFFVCFLIVTANDCQACEEADTYENIMDNYCRADFGESLGSFWFNNKFHFISFCF